MIDDCGEGEECKELNDYHVSDSFVDDSFTSDYDVQYLEMISYHYKMSNTFVETNETKSVTYASDHAINGQIVYDTVATSTVEPLVANGFNFIV